MSAAAQRLERLTKGHSMSRREITLYSLKFPDLDDLEVRMRTMPLKDFFAVQRLAKAAGEDADASEAVLRKVAEYIVSWNRETEAGEPVPANFEGLCDEELPIVLQIFSAWVEAIASVPNPSPGNSPSTASSPGPQLAMAEASEPLAS